MLPPLAEVIAQFDLEPHPEGGYYRRTYEANLQVPHAALPAAYAGARPVASAILYLLERGQVSRLHRLCSDEMWHFHLGGPLLVVELPTDPSDAVRETTLGADILAGARLQHTVTGGTFFGAAMPQEAQAPYTLVGCTVHPGFDFAEFEFAEREALLKRYANSPRARAWIERLN